MEGTRYITNIRIHVERVIGLVRQKYPILCSTIPVYYVTKRPGEDLPLLTTLCMYDVLFETFVTQLYHLNNVIVAIIQCYYDDKIISKYHQYIPK